MYIDLTLPQALTLLLLLDALLVVLVIAWAVAERRLRAYRRQREKWRVEWTDQP